MQFNGSKTQSYTLSLKNSNNTKDIVLQNVTLQKSHSFDMVGAPFHSALDWRKHMTPMKAIRFITDRVLLLQRTGFLEALGRKRVLTHAFKHLTLKTWNLSVCPLLGSVKFLKPIVR